MGCGPEPSRQAAPTTAALPPPPVKYGLSSRYSTSFHVTRVSFKPRGGVSGSKNSSVVKKFFAPLQITLPPGHATPEALAKSGVINCCPAAGTGVKTAKAMPKHKRVRPTLRGRNGAEHIFFLLLSRIEGTQVTRLTACFSGGGHCSTY